MQNRILTWLVVMAGIGITAANVTMRSARSQPETTMSDFRVGDPLPKLTLAELPNLDVPPVTAPLPVGCRLLVVFSWTCPHCRTTAAREATVPDSSRLPSLWITDADTREVRDFASLLGTKTALRVGGKETLQALKVRAVPLVFLVSADDRIRSVSAYSGSAEDHAVLRKLCSVDEER